MASEFRPNRSPGELCGVGVASGMGIGPVQCPILERCAAIFHLPAASPKANWI